MKATRLLLLMLLTLSGALSANAQEAYCAVEYADLSDGLRGATVTYYYDDQRYNWDLTVDLDGVRGENISYVDKLTIVFDRSFAEYRPTDTSYWFSSLPCKGIVTFEGWENLNTSMVTNMCGMFEGLGNFNDWTNGINGLYSVENLDLSHFDTSNVTNMSAMLYNVVGVDNLDISSFTINPDTETNMMMGFPTTGYSVFKRIILPATANNLAANAFDGIGSTEEPCTLICPYGYPSINYVVNGDCEGNDVTCLWGRDYGNENYLNGANTHFVNGEGYNGTRGIKVQNDYNSTGYNYDTQFFVYTPNHVWKTGETFRFKMKVRADKEASIQVQAHREPSEYITYKVLNQNYPIPTEWWEMGYKGTVTDEQDNMQTLCFNLNVSKEANNYYFDDISWEHVADSYNIFEWKGGTFITIEPEAYAQISTDEKTMTFYYDENRSSREGTTYDLNTEYERPSWKDDDYYVTKVVFDRSFANARPTSCYYWFRNMSALKSITDIENLKTDEVTNMYMMFFNCSSLEALDVSHFNTSNVTDMDYMFSGCSTLTSLDVSHFDTSKVNTMENMFSGCSGLKSLDLSSFTFISKSYTMMSGCSSLRELRLSDSANNMAYNACDGVGTQSNPCILIYSNGFTPDGITPDGNGVYQWKNGYFKDAEIEAYAVLSADEKELTFFYDNFRNKYKEKTFSLNKNANRPGWYSNGSTIETVEFNYTFADARPTTCYEWFFNMNKLQSIEGIEYLRTDEVVNMAKMFDGCPSLMSLDVSGFNTSKVTNMSYMFSVCSNLKDLDVSGFNTSKVTDMHGMFYKCSKLTSLDVSGFNTSNVTNMESMFNGCSTLTSLDVSGFNTMNVTLMRNMFDSCSKLMSLDVSGFDTSKVINMRYMFDICTSLTSLDLSGFTFKEDTNTEYFLLGCSNLKKLIIPATANNLNENACRLVGKNNDPCLLIYPSDIEIDKTGYEENGYFKWKSGYFIDYMLGDANDDGKVTVTDVMMTVNHSLGKTPAGFNLRNANVNGDKDENGNDKVNITDVMLILKMINN